MPRPSKRLPTDISNQKTNNCLDKYERNVSMISIIERNGQYYLKKEGASPIFLSAGLGSTIEALLPKNQSPVKHGSQFIAPLHAPEIVSKVHTLYAEAGADILTADTFCASFYRQGGDIKLTQEFVSNAAKIATVTAQSCGQAPLVALSLTSLEDCYTPEDTPNSTTLKIEHKRNLDLLSQHGHLILAETLPTLREAKIIASLAQTPFLLSFTVGTDGKVLDGNTMQEVVETILKPNSFCLGVGVNCCSVKGAQQAVSELTTAFNADPALTGKQIIAYPNGFRESREDNGHSGCNHDGNQKPTFSPTELSNVIGDLVARGATAVGGCCGAGPQHTQAYVQNFK